MHFAVLYQKECQLCMWYQVSQEWMHNPKSEHLDKRENRAQVMQWSMLLICYGPKLRKKALPRCAIQQSKYSKQEKLSYIAKALKMD